MSATNTLEAVCIELDHWRSTRKKSGKIPDKIWAKTLKLLDRYSMNEVRQALRLSHTQLKNKLKQKDPFTLNSETPFYEIAVTSIKHQQTHIHLGTSIELKRPDGTILSIQHLSDRLLLNLISTFIGVYSCFN